MKKALRITDGKADKISCTSIVIGSYVLKAHNTFELEVVSLKRVSKSSLSPTVSLYG